MRSTNKKEYDLILIGSGIGALTVASLMAQLRGKRILILERHYVAGGYTHSFKRKGFHWDPGLHYVGQLKPGSGTRNLFDLVTNQQVQWNRMLDPFEKFVYPGFTFNLYGDPKHFQTDLIERFPNEARAIRRYFKDIEKGATALFLHTVQQNGKGFAKLLSAIAKLWHGIDLNLTTQQYLDQHFQDPLLKVLLTSQWGDYGLPPAKSPFVLHATIASHYLEGGYYPVGGPGKIAQSVQQLVEAQGGNVLLCREVQEILLNDGRAVGVRALNLTTNQFEDYYASTVVSNAGAYNTYLNFIPSHYPIPFREALQQFYQDHPPATNVSLYIGFSGDPRQMGFQGENHWIYNTYDHQAIEQQKGAWIQDGEPLHVYLSFPSLKDPEAKKHTAEIIASTDYRSFAPWRDQTWLHRDNQYQALKKRIKNGLLAAVECHYPGFSEQVEYCEVSTPLTNEHFTAHPQGSMYGLPMTPERFAPQNLAWTRIKTPISGLYLTGSDVYTMGILGALMGGLLTTSQLPDGVSIPQVFSAAAKAKSALKSDNRPLSSVTSF